MRSIRFVTAFLLGTMTSVSAHSGTFNGTIKDGNGAPLSGVMVRLTEISSNVSESVYSDSKGRYSLSTSLEGELKLRLRTPYFSDVSQVISLKENSVLEKNLTMTLMTDDMEISDSLPAAYHFGNLPFDEESTSDFSRLKFQRDCLSCHQLGNKFTRIKRSPESWANTIERMHKYMGNFDMDLRDSRAVMLSEGFSDKPSMVRPVFPVDPVLSSAKIFEYPLTRDGVPHDTIFNPNDGLLYTVDQWKDTMSITDRDTGLTEYILQEGGEAMSYLSGIEGVADVIGEFNPGEKHGPHSLAMGLDGKYYVTNSGSRSIGVFNPSTRKWEASHLIPEGTGAFYAHTIRADTKGNLWFTLTGSEQVGRLNPASGEFSILPLPEHKPMGVAGTTQPYGIAVNPQDNSIWYGRLFADKIGRIDPDTLEILEYNSPVSGPRRMRFDGKGILWVTGYSYGELARIDVMATAAQKNSSLLSKVYPLPEFADGYRPAPYALGVHPVTQDIWINENMTDRIYRFLPDEERFVVYPVPLRGTYTRDMTFTEEGDVCTSNNPIPAPALEGGLLEIICIDPDFQ
jgi:streptogramin lyase